MPLDDSDGDSDRVDNTTLSSGDSQLVIHQSSNSKSYASLCSPISDISNNNTSITAASCSCTNTFFHLFFCPVPFSKRVSLYFTTPSSVLPRILCSFDVNNVMSQCITSLSGASDAQKQLINVGSNVARASCLLKQDVWSSLLVD